MASRASPVADGCWTRRAGDAYLPAMRIACPNCAAEYEVPDAALAAGPRLLRCAKCSHQFPAGLPVPEPAPPAAAPLAPAPKPAPKPALAPILPPQATPTSSGTDRVALFGWIATLFLLLGGTAAVFTHHAAIAAAWPPAQRLFSALGLE
jgi:predicted Zn finger-like uncharacterized protein